MSWYAVLTSSKLLKIYVIITVMLLILLWSVILYQYPCPYTWKVVYKPVNLHFKSKGAVYIENGFMKRSCEMCNVDGRR